ncbi:MAG: hypothetical protein KKA16_05330 [Alphaproteobacteria bacterium]|nr:hypothetical protein [Alphaproteobacteria bacterium]MBU2380285.1 hypothetical protein [Alphaproteobacteria bacterium]
MPVTDPREDDTPDPRERDLSRRSQNPSVGVWVVLALLLIAAAGVYVLSAIL